MSDQPIVRIYHPWDQWECYRSGFFATTHDGCDKNHCEKKYAAFLANTARFESAMLQVFAAWPRSCEHWLTNAGMNRVAWLGQAAACIWLRLPARHRAGYKRMKTEHQQRADELAQYYLDAWLERHERRLQAVR